MGSNIYKILGIGGITMMVSPVAVPRDLWPFDLAVMAGAAVAVLAIVGFGRRIGRTAGTGLLLGYAAFLAVLLAGG